MKFDRKGLDRLIKHLDKVQNPNPTPLLVTTAKLMEEDNRRGVLGRTDKDGSYMFAVTYRPKTSINHGKGRTANARQRNNVKGRVSAGAFSGFGPAAAGFHNNLTPKEYRQLNGPPLAPRRQFSRVITNYNLAPYVTDRYRFGVIGAWLDVVNSKGKPFLRYLFDGTKNTPARDLRGIRPEGMRKIRRAFIAWASDQIRYNRGAA